MRLLVTRPAEDGAATCAALEALGHEGMCEPLITIRDVALSETDGRTLTEALKSAQALLVTSANGARALRRQVSLHLPDGAGEISQVRVLAVGAASAEAMGQAGFADVHQAEGDSAALADLAARVCSPDGGALVHISGQAVAGDLQGLLAARGFEVARFVLYEAEASTRFSAATRGALEAGALDGVLFFSARTAKIFCHLCKEERLEGVLRGLRAFCLSASVAQVAQTAPFGGVCTAQTPTQAGLLELVGPPM